VCWGPGDRVGGSFRVSLARGWGQGPGEHTQWLEVGGSETGDFNKSH
jgi:hypothetical protein